MRFQNSHYRLGSYQTAQGRKSHLWRNPQSIYLLLNARSGNILGVRNLYHLTSYLAHHVEDLFAQIFLRSALPIITMYDIIGLQLHQIGNIAPVILWHYLGHIFDILHHILSLFPCQIRQASMVGYRLVCKQTYNDIAIFGSLVNDIDVSRMHNITYHS